MTAHRDPAAEALAASAPDLVLRVGRVVTGGPDGEVRYTSVIASGAVSYEEGSDDPVDISLTDTAAHASAVLAGEMDPNALFMRGQTKVTGDTGPILDLLAATKTEAYTAILADVAGTSAS